MVKLYQHFATILLLFTIDVEKQHPYRLLKKQTNIRSNKETGKQTNKKKNQINKKKDKQTTIQ